MTTSTDGDGLAGWTLRQRTPVSGRGRAADLPPGLQKYLQTAEASLAEPFKGVTTDGRVVGRHDGIAYYTLGQRQGLGVGGTRDGDDLPWFVAGKDIVWGPAPPVLKAGAQFAVVSGVYAGDPDALSAIIR